jgi:hypothetical protein
MPRPLRPAHLADVDEAFNAGSDLYKRAVVVRAGHIAGDRFTGLVTLRDSFPGIGGHVFDAERNPLFLAIKLDDFGGDRVSRLENFGGRLNAAPGNILRSSPKNSQYPSTYGNGSPCSRRVRV